jgi:hypothetical protein
MCLDRSSLRERVLQEREAKPRLCAGRVLATGGFEVVCGYRRCQCVMGSVVVAPFFEKPWTDVILPAFFQQFYEDGILKVPKIPSRAPIGASLHVPRERGFTCPVRKRPRAS